jgi:anthranilate synthase component 2
MNIIDKFHNKLPILGICLGHQAIAEYFGAKLYRLDIIKHGIKSGIFKTVDDKLHYRLKDEIFVGRYHSWAVKLPLPECLIAQSFTKDKILMSFKHTKYNIFGLQYHPESIITEQGDIIIQNWLKLI